MNVRLESQTTLDSERQRFHPIALDTWTAAFDTRTDTLVADDRRHAIPRDNLWSSYDYARAIAVAEAALLQPEYLRSFGELALCSSVTNQAGRNGRYFTAQTMQRLEEVYPDPSDRYAVQFGDALPQDLTRFLCDNDDIVTSLEVARDTHINAWRSGHDVNGYVRMQLLDDPELGAEFDRDDIPRHKIKTFGALFEQGGVVAGPVLAERKRTVMRFVGGVELVMRFNYLIDQHDPSIDAKLSSLIEDERKQFAKRDSGKSYNFEAENEMLRGLVDHSVRNPDFQDKPSYIIPLQTGYYVYSPSAHEAEKKRILAEEKAVEERGRLARLAMLGS